MLEKVDGKRELCRFDGVGSVTVYLGALGGMMEKLEDVTDKVKWHKEYCEPLCMDIETVTFDELIEQFGRYLELDGHKVQCQSITVVEQGPLGGTIYGTGNYPEETCFRVIGTLAGYA
jgi:hypothetical protein